MKSFRNLLAICLLALSASLGHAEPAEAEAGPARAERLLVAMGGREVWANTTALIVEATHYRLPSPTSYSNRIINDLTRPRMFFEAHAPGLDRWTSIDGDTGRQRRDQEPITTASAERVAEENAWWEANIYRTLHRLANRDPALTPRAVGDDRLEILTSEGRLNWFRLNADGAPVLYGTGEESEATIFGPLEEHASGLRYPAWGSGDLGAWRYVIVRFVVNPRLTEVDFLIPQPSAQAEAG